MIFTTRSKAASYSAGMVLTGSPISNDSAPTDLASVTILRRLAFPPGFLLSSAATVCAFAYDGSNAVVRPWWYDATLNLWIPNGNTGTLVSAGAASLVQVVGYMPGALFFLQVVSNVGNATKIAFLLR
jgi:hypothetical protein